MDYITAYKKLVVSALFKKWKKKSHSTYLAHFFGEVDEQLNIGQWQIGFYDTVNDRITSFVVGNAIEQMPSEEVFKKEGIVEELELEKVEMSEKEALETALLLQKKKYPQHPTLKGIVILQHLTIGLVWNVTLITQTFAALNVKIDTHSKKVIEDSLNTFFDLANTSE